MGKKVEKKRESFEEALKRLESIVEEMEKGPDIEVAVTLYEEGISLVKKLEERLDRIERKVYEVKNMQKLLSDEEENVQLGLFEE
ncbi:MAG: exodeoxyribonuclease VII small subunit [Brevinematales bacterium]|nr:exodeoxyribonuclease VII small subunit [Brevinematales bacterium]